MMPLYPTARSRLAVTRRILKRRRSVVLASLENSHALSKASALYPTPSSLEKGSTGAFSKCGPGMAFIGLGISNSTVAQVKKDDKLTKTP